MLFAILTLISRALGLIKNQLLAFKFGTTGQSEALDAYFSAFRIPDFIFNILILGAITASFLPLLVKHLTNNDQKKADQLISNVLHFLLLVLGIISVLAYFSSPYLLKLIVPWFSAEKFTLTLNLTKIMLLSPIFLGISAIFGGIINAHKKFIYYGLAPIFYNLGIIGWILFLSPIYGIYGAAYGVVIGWFLHLILQFWGSKKIGWHHYWIFSFNNEIKKMLKLALPRIGGLAANQINLLVDTIIASTLMAGSVAIFNLTDTIQNFPVAILGLTVSTISFPHFAQYFAQKKYQKIESYLHHYLKKIFLGGAFMTIMTILFWSLIIKILLEYGQFNAQDSHTAYLILSFFALSFIPQSIIPLLVKFFYANHNTTIPFICSFLSVILNIIFSLIFVYILDLSVQWLALSYSLASWFSFLLLYFWSKKYLKFLINPSL